MATKRFQFPTDQSVGYQIRDTFRASSRVMQANIAKYGLTLGQWYYLRALWDEDGMTQRELSRRVGMMEPTTVTAVNSMERDGYIRRVRNKTDRRKVNIFLTPKGRRLRERALPLAKAAHKVMATHLNEREVKTLFRLLEKVRKGCDAHLANLNSLAKH